ncbi:hypothetical protein [Pedobacter sp. JY14-1]|uniref:hypothetical protein n=1 Tax=Pedobacter sp. JY14-1 TaxID=3034151 RepID=UPI0023E22968|nr:hypothetical protein [Pedobacter sp. JY14-1]
MKAVISVIGVLILGTIGYLFYFASQISAVYPPIKTYVYNGVDYSLQQSIEDVVNRDSTLSFTITGVTGIGEPHKYYADVSYKRGTHRYIFNINYETKKSFWRNNKYTDLALTGTFDETNKTGGYLKKDKGVNDMVILLEEILINRLISD